MPDWQSAMFSWIVLTVLAASIGILAYIVASLYVESRVLSAVKQQLHNLKIQ